VVLKVHYANDFLNSLLSVRGSQHYAFVLAGQTLRGYKAKAIR